MRRCKRTVKRLDAEFSRVLLEPIPAHERDRTEAAHVGIVQSSAIVEVETQGGIIELVAVKTAVVDEQRAGEARLYDQAITGVEVDHHQLCPAPAAEDRRVVKPFGKSAWSDSAQHVTLPNRDFFYLSPANRAVEIARDRLRLRYLGHRASAHATRYPAAV